MRREDEVNVRKPDAGEAPVVVNLRSSPHWEVYIGRGSKWGNPFRIGRDGDRATVIEKYREHLKGSRHLRDALGELTGLRLACYCKPEACHGDVLVEAWHEWDSTTAHPAEWFAR